MKRTVFTSGKTGSSIQKDTLYKDKIKYEYKEVPVEVEKPLTGIQKALITFGKVFILALLALLGYFGIKKFILKM